MNFLASLDLIILFFIFGLTAGLIKSDLKIPDSISKFISIFLLLSIGLKGGQAVLTTDSLESFGLILTIGMASCVIIPIYIFYFFKKSIGSKNASALGACYGSVSAITFIAAQSYLQNVNIESSGFMVAVMAIMEIPAIIIALWLSQREAYSQTKSFKSLLISVLTSKSVVLLVGSFLIGLTLDKATWSSIKPVFADGFKGVLALFLIDLGLSACERFKELKSNKMLIVLIGILIPFSHGVLSLLLAHSFGISDGNCVLLAVLIGSASYIAAPAAIIASIPEANPALYLTLPLSITFPFNVLVALPLYVKLIQII